MSPFYQKRVKQGAAYGMTWKGTLLARVPVGVVTRTLPVVAPAGTVAVMREWPSTVNVADTPVKAHLRGAGQIGPQNVDHRSHPAGGGPRF